MNLSGQAVVPLARYFEIDPSRWIVVHDEMDLPLGRIKWKRSGGAGGHNGIASIIEHLGHGDFRRVRLGVGRPRGDAVGHVLGGFAPDEVEAARTMIEEAADLAVLFGRGGDKAVNDRLAQQCQMRRRADEATEDPGATRAEGREDDSEKSSR